MTEAEEVADVQVQRSGEILVLNSNEVTVKLPRGN